MALGTPFFALRADLVGSARRGVPAGLEFVAPESPVAISIPSLIVIIPSRRAGT